MVWCLIEKRMKKFLPILSIFLLLISFQNVSAQRKSTKQKKAKPIIISCGVCNQRAIYLPKPEYPNAAKFARASGKVEVQILIDEKGNVESAKAISGNPLLRAASEKAALQAKFEPFKLSGNPVKVAGTIIYNFSLDYSDETKKEIAFIETIPLGVLNDSALKISFAQNQAKDSRMTGELKVEIIINLQEGKVISAKTNSGHPILRVYAETSARNTMFQPILTEFPTIYGTGILIFKAEDFTGKVAENKNPKSVLPIIVGGIMNGGAKTLVKPEYTDEAKKACASGKVEVITLIYMATGKVISAKAVSGDELLRRPAENAVMKSKFSVPNITGDKNVYIKGKIIYNFVPEKGCENK